MDNKFIENIADHIRTVLQVKSPVDLDSVISDLQGTLVEYSNINAPHENCIKPLRLHNNSEEKSLFEIGIHCNSVSYERKRFLIAHELGHLFLHLNFTDPDEWGRFVSANKSFSWYESVRQEYEANTFAENILMPRFEFMSVVDRCTKEEDLIEVDDVANYFKVTRSAAISRGRSLRLFD